MPQTLEEIRREGLDALRERLGVVGMIRFLQQFENGTGDYARERHAWVDEFTIDSLQAERQPTTDMTPPTAIQP